MNTTSTTENRLWAVLSHLSALTLGMGILLPIIGWSDQRRKSNYATFQNLQALGYQSLGYTVWLLSYLVIVIVASIIVLATSRSDGDSTDPNAGPTPGLIIFAVVMLAFFALYFLL